MTIARRSFLTGALATGILAGAATEGSAAMNYGSGELSDWTTKSKAISTATFYNRAKTDNGVWMFGDSIANADDSHLAGLLAPRTLAVNNWNSRPTPPAVDALEDAISVYNGLPNYILMATGTNDIFDPPGFGAQVDRTMALVAGQAQVIWVNVYCGRFAVAQPIRESDIRNSGWVNNQLWARAGKYDNLSIVDWYGFLCGNPGYRIGNLLSDGVHTTVPLGQNSRNSLIMGAL